MLGYDPTYISMIETGRREITDIATRLRIARHVGVPPHVVGVADPDDADFAAMLQFGESTIRLAVLARQSGHGAEAVNELWPVVARLETRAAEGHIERDVLLLLARARAELGVSLGYVLPEERLTSAARWTGRALWLAERLDENDLLAFALRVHGNELRKVERPAAAVARLEHAAGLATEHDRGAVLAQLARAMGECGDPSAFDKVIGHAREIAEGRSAGTLASPYALHEIHLRGLLCTGRTRQAVHLLGQHSTAGPGLPPQWHAILQVTIGQVLLAAADHPNADAAFRAAITVARDHRLPHQIQRIIRATANGLQDVGEAASVALDQLRIERPSAKDASHVQDRGGIPARTRPGRR